MSITSNEWNQLVRGHLENVFESVIKDYTLFTVNNLGGSFYKKVLPIYKIQQ